MLVALVCIGVIAHAEEQNKGAGPAPNQAVKPVKHQDEPTKAAPVTETLGPETKQPSNKKAYKGPSPEVAAKMEALLKQPRVEGDTQSCIESGYMGAADSVLVANMYLSNCAFISRSNSGFPERKYTFNCCASSAVIRVNQTDWNNLRNQGKLDGLRYQQIFWDGNSYSVSHKRMKGSGPEEISTQQYLP
ncbi:hypothetical protein LXT21_32970 [Myxococcus sp. K38C18041901]|uniref:hypothetical protein n=1 Tax=Myxococcus guangdongensis TaxID=2906760 RepID=UPI0020A71C71|nr:hypothetical protein [Myxococcus guangdongensis]MCP3063599.1 hypothetical protein [Myxococcus guangdongensis]